MVVSGFIPGDVVRVVGWRGTFRVRSIDHERNWATVWGGTASHFGMRTIELTKLKRSRPGDVVPGFPPRFLSPLRRAVR